MPPPAGKSPPAQYWRNKATVDHNASRRNRDPLMSDALPEAA